MEDVFCVKCGRKIDGYLYVISSQLYCPECAASLPAQSITISNYYQPPPQGWVCPRCGAVNSPLVMQCPCSLKAVSSEPWKTTPTETWYVSWGGNSNA